jgi:hypothetical protein
VGDQLACRRARPTSVSSLTSDRRTGGQVSQLGGSCEGDDGQAASGSHEPHRADGSGARLDRQSDADLVRDDVRGADVRAAHDVIPSGGLSAVAALVILREATA